MDEIGYSGGTVTVAPGETAVAGSSVLWGANIEPGDTFEAAGDRVTIASATNNGLVLVRPWAGAGINGSAAYFIRYDSTRRNTVDLSLKVRQLVRELQDAPRFLPLSNPPDDAIGSEGQFGIVTETSELFLKVAGEWVSQGQALGVAWTTGTGAPSDANGKAGDFYLRDGGDVWRKEGASWVLVASITGPQGPSGTLAFDPDVETLPYGAQAGAANVGTPQAAILKLALPEGPQGDVGPQGQGLDVDAHVDTLAELAAYDAQPAGFMILVSDDGNGRAVVLSKLSAAAGDWTEPAPIVDGFSGNYGDLSGKPQLGSAAALDAGEGAGNLVRLDTEAKLPAVDGSQLLNLPIQSTADLDLAISLLALQVASNANSAISLGNKFADSFGVLTYVDVAGAVNLSTATAGVLKPSTPNAQVTGGSDTGSPPAVWFDGVETGSTAGVFTTNYGRDWGAGTPRTISRIRIVGATTRGTSTNAASGTLVVEGSNDGSTWTGLAITNATQPNIQNAGAIWDSVISNPASYRYLRWRLSNTANDGSAFLAEVSYFEAVQPFNVTVSSASLDFGFVPDQMALLARLKKPAGFDLAVDTSFELSRDGGATYAAAPLAQVIAQPADMIVVQSDWVDVSAQPSGQQLRWRWKTHNNKAIELHDVCLMARGAA